MLYAAETNDISTVRTLLADSADVNACSQEGWTPLIMAAKEGHVELLHQLLEAGAQVDPPDESHSALRGAALFGREECLRSLLRAKADCNVASKGGKTALMGCCMNGHATSAALLLEHRADPTLVNEYGETALDLATSRGHAACVELLNKVSGE